MHAGILAHSAEGAALCFLTFCREGFRQLGPHQHPDVTVDCIAMGESMTAWEDADHAMIRTILEESAGRLAGAGAQYFACPDNTAHIALEVAGPPLALPGLHIAEVVAAHADSAGYRRVGVLGTRFTLSGPVYRRALGRRGIDYVVPDAEDRRLLDRIIFDELVEGVFTERAKREYARVIRAMQDDGCDAVALACTEIPLIVTPDSSPLPILDSTRLLARAAYEVAVGERPMPMWRGGVPVLAS